MSFSLLRVNNQDLILTLHICTAGSIKVCFGHWKLSNSELLFGGHSGKSVAVVSLNDPQRAKKLVCDRTGLVDFAIGLVVFVLNLPDR